MSSIFISFYLLQGMRPSHSNVISSMVRMMRDQKRPRQSLYFSVTNKFHDKIGELDNNVKYGNKSTRFPLIRVSRMSSFSSDHENFVPASTVETISLLHDHFNRLTNVNGIMELYDSATMERMWQSVLLRNKKGTKMTENSSLEIVTSSLKDDTDGGNSDTTVKAAGVLVLFVLVNGTDFSVVLTRRSKHLSQHASEISFAGGHFDAQTDGSLVDTAVREAVEELYGGRLADTAKGQEEFRKQLHVFGSASAVPSLRGTPVTPVLAMYAATKDDPSPVLTTEYLGQLWPGNRDEVDVVFTVPVETLMKQHTGVEMTTTDRRFQEPSELVQTSKKNTTKVPPQYSTSFGRVWGLTAYILQPIVEKLLIPMFCRTASMGATTKLSP
jgi:hypothetical protein